MPYIHNRCGGEIGLFSRRCKKCGKQWPIWVLFGLAPPKDMYYYVPPKPETKKGKTSYASWAEKYPAVAGLASRMPNWPRWARIATASFVVVALVVAILKIAGVL